MINLVVKAESVCKKGKTVSVCINRKRVSVFPVDVGSTTPEPRNSFCSFSVFSRHPVFLSRNQTLV